MKQENADLPQVLNLNEAAQFIRISEKTLGEIARQNRIPCQKVGREWRFLRPALENWLTGNEEEGVRSGKDQPTQVQRKQGNLSEESGFRDTAFTKNRNEPLHRWVPWIAGYSAAFVDGVFDQLVSKPAEKVTILDPFSGVGTTLVEGFKRGYNVAGFEINPFAALACRIKLNCHGYDLALFRKRARQFLQFMAKHESDSAMPKSSAPPGFVSRSPFFSPSVERQVLFVLDFIQAEKEAWLQDVIRLALGSVMVGFSNYSYEPSLGRRASAGKSDVLEAEVAAVLASKLEEMRLDMELLRQQMSSFPHLPKAHVYAESFLEKGARLPAHSIDLLITSPPYLNNYHYLRNSRPHLYWLNMVKRPEDLKEMEQQSFGKFWQTVRSGPILTLAFHDTELERLINRLRRENPEREVYGGIGWANYAVTYFNDCDRFFRVTNRVLRRGGRAVIVIGNNILQGIEFKTDELLARIAERHGFETIRLHRVRTKRTGSSIINSSVRVGAGNHRAELYETAVELRLQDQSGLSRK